MKKQTQKAVAVLAVVVVIAAAAGALILLSDRDPGRPGAVGSSAVYGNVNGDCYIDDRDVAVVQDIIDGRRDLADWPLADANLDGTVDEADLDIVRKASKGEGTTLYVVDSDGAPVELPYPITDHATGAGTNFRSIIAVLGLADGMLANTTSNSISGSLDRGLYEGRQSGRIADLSSGFSDVHLTVEDVTLMVNLGVKVYLAENTGDMTPDEDIVTLMEGAGIRYILLNCKETDECLATARCLGIMFQREKAAEDYCAWCEGVTSAIVGNEGDRFGTVTCLCATMTNYVSGTSSDYYGASLKVGGDNLADWEKSILKFNAGDTWLYDHKYDAEFMFHFRSTTFPTVGESYFDSARTYFGETYTFKSGGYYLINGVIPLPVRNALMAEIMYPDCFQSGWADGLFQYYFEHFLGQAWDPSYEYFWNVARR